MNESQRQAGRQVSEQDSHATRRVNNATKGPSAFPPSSASYLSLLFIVCHSQPLSGKRETERGTEIGEDRRDGERASLDV